MKKLINTTKTPVPTLVNKKLTEGKEVEAVVRIADYRTSEERRERLLALVASGILKKDPESIKKDPRKEVAVYIGSKIYWIPVKMGKLFPGSHCKISYLLDEKNEPIKSSMVVIAR
jgi:hypothetical protein